MAVEIQSLILGKVVMQSVGQTSDILRAGICDTFPVDGVYPYEFSCHFYLQLRKDSPDSEENFECVLEAFDADMKSIAKFDAIKGFIGKGGRFVGANGQILLTLPTPGDYLIRASVRSETSISVNVFNYHIVAATKKRGAR